MEVLTFFLGHEKYAVDIELVDAIENIIPATLVPKAKAYAMGLINIRGNVLPVIDIGLVLGKNNDNNLPKLVIINLSSGKMALSVTDVDEVLNVEDKNTEVVTDAGDLVVINNNGDIITLLTQDYLLNI